MAAEPNLRPDKEVCEVKKITGISIAAVCAALLIPIQAKADLFGADLGFLAQLVQQGIQAARQATQAYNQIREYAAFIQHPGSIQNAISRVTMDAGAAIRRASNGSDSEALARLDQTIQATQGAIQEAVYASGKMNAANAASLSELILRQAEMVNRRDQLNRSLQTQGRIDELNNDGAGDLGDVSDTLRGRILK